MDMPHSMTQKLHQELRISWHDMYIKQPLLHHRVLALSRILSDLSRNKNTTSLWVGSVTTTRHPGPITLCAHPRHLLVFLQHSNVCLQASKAYEKHCAAQGKPTDHAKAKELMYETFSTRPHEFFLIVHTVLLQVVPSLIGSSRPRV